MSPATSFTPPPTHTRTHARTHHHHLHSPPPPLSSQISQAAMSPATSFIATPAASWIDDFLSWTNPSLPKCCR